MIEHFIYDFDGTLSDSYPVFLQILKEIMARYGGTTSCSDEELYRKMKDRVVEAYRAVKWQGDVSKDLFFEDFVDAQDARYAEFQLFPDAERLLRAVVESGKKNYLYTHSGKPVYRIMEKMGISQYFTFVLDATQGFSSKPAPDALLSLIDRFDLDPQTCVMIGDRPIDVQAGANAGMQSCLFDSDGFFPNTPATYHVSGLAEILKLI